MPSFDKVLVTPEMMMEPMTKEDACVLCGRPTGWVSLFFEVPLCSTECHDTLEGEWVAAHNADREIPTSA